MVNCLRLLMQEMVWAFAFALARAGKSKLARIAMMAMTTSNSIKVNPLTALDNWRFELIPDFLQWRASRTEADDFFRDQAVHANRKPKLPRETTLGNDVP